VVRERGKGGDGDRVGERKREREIDIAME